MSEELALAVKDAVSVVNDPHMGVSIVAAQAKAEALKVEGIDKVKLIIEGHVMADSLNEMLNKDN